MNTLQPRNRPAQFLAYFLLLILGFALAMGSGLAFYPAFFPQYSEPFAQLFVAPGIARSTGVSLLAGLLTPAASLASVFLFLAATQGSKLGRWISQLAAPVLAIPHAAAAFGLLVLLSPTGVVSRAVASLMQWQTPPDVLFPNDSLGLAFVAGLTLKEIPFLLFVSLALLPSLNAPRRVALARTLGHTPTAAWLLSVAPALYGLIRLPVFAVIVFASSAVDVALILGPSLPPTLGVRLLEWFSSPESGARELAAAAAVLQLGVTLTALACWVLLEKCAARIYRRFAERGPFRFEDSVREAVLKVCGLSLLPMALLLSFASLFALLLASLAKPWRYPALLPADWSAASWSQALNSFAAPLGNALAIALLSVALAVLVAVLFLEAIPKQAWFNRYAALLLSLPLLVPQLVFLSGFTLLFEELRIAPALGTVVVGHFFFVLPYIYLTLRTAYLSLDSRWMQLAATLGATRTQRFLRVRLPLLSSALLTATMLGAAISLSLYLPTQLLGAGRVATITTEALALVTSGERTTIGVWALLQAAVPVCFYSLALALPPVIWSQRKGMMKGL